ncbi:hypothetical protein [Sorangium sp. So ce1335]|uniref:hypothetical protein n=1 Tax=Sorangium sp. So ce1335 TaxID=3133335 RepID=UPI003F60E298
MRTECRRVASAAMFALVLGVVSTQAEASELSAGVSLGWIQAGTAPRLALDPHAGISWQIEKNLLLKLHDLCSLVPPTQVGGAGVQSHIRFLGCRWKDGDAGAGPSVAIYFVPACGNALCGQVAGMAVGASIDQLVEEVDDCLEALSPYPGSPASLRPVLCSPVADSGSAI